MTTLLLILAAIALLAWLYFRRKSYSGLGSGESPIPFQIGRSS